MRKIKLELTPKEMRMLFVFGVTAMCNHFDKHKTILNSERRALEEKLHNAFLQTETNNQN